MTRNMGVIEMEGRRREGVTLFQHKRGIHSFVPVGMCECVKTLNNSTENKRNSTIMYRTEG